NVLSDGSSRVAMNLSTGSNSNNYLRLPLNATVTSSSLQVSTLSTLTLSGSDVRDSYLHQPNPSYGNAANKDKNFGNHTHTVVGKTEWANWNIYRGVYWFDLSVLPGATVLDANLSLFVSDGVKQAGSTQTVTTSHYYTIFPLSKQWEEGQEVNAAVTNGPGVTWNNAIDNVTGTDFAWSASGASGGADKLSSVGIVYDSPANLEMNWLNYQNQNLTDLVQSWANGTVINNGLLLTGDENTSKPDGSRLTIIARQNSTHGPRLVITFAGSDDVTAGLDVGADGNFEWNHTGNLSNASSIPDFSNTLNDYLANASASFTDDWGNEFVDIPLNITGNSTLVISDIEVQYDWEAAVTISPNNDLLSEMNQHLSNGTVDATGNVSIPINVTSGSAGSIKLLNLWLGQGDRPPSIGAISLPGNTIVPDGEIDSIDIEVTSYQGLNNLSWVTMYPLLSNVASRPMFFHSFENDTTWINDPSNFVDNMSGYWNPLNSDTGRMSWNFSSNWNWPVLENVIWQTQAWTVDGLSVNRPSSQKTFHENRLHITSFVVYDETAPSDSSTIVEPTEWVAGGDTLRVAGTIRFLDETSYPMVNDVVINLQNISGNGTVDSSGAYSIFTQVPSLNQYDGLTIGANLSINDYTTPGLAHLTFNVDATSPGMLANSPIGTRILPEQNQLFNVTITDGSDSLGLDNGSLMMRYWVEGLHDDGDGIPQYSEYANKPLLRVNQSDYFHAKFDDTFNAHGQLVSIFIEGSDKVGNLLGSGPGVANDSIHYTSLVPQSSTLENFSFTLPGGDTLVPGHLAWINLTLSDINGLEDLEKIELILGQSRGFTW
ncbi:MAG TPA: DNRLRE domain-containing protein, partial [Candidatus Poseidoniales archaeon]|nr:DNRLRE domain-containing protein [Candidatus Poseidoniales archaeon]